MSEKTYKFLVVPAAHMTSTNGDLRLVIAKRRPQRDMDFLLDMGLSVEPGDEIEITARVVSRVVTERRPVEPEAGSGVKLTRSEGGR